MTQGDVARFERTVLPHLDDAYTLARYLVRDEHDAQDVVQEAALRAFRYFDGFVGGDGRSWLLAIVRNCSMTWLARRRTDDRVTPLMDEDDFDAASADAVSAPGADAEAIRSSERKRIERALATLPAEFREVIVLREIEDLSYREISDVVGVPIGTVMSRLARARKRLADLLIDVREAS